MYKKLLSIILCVALCFSALSYISCKKDESFTVTFSGGHEDARCYYGEENEIQVVTNANQIVEPIYVREGYNFVGWNVSISRIKSSTTVVAQWKKYEMDITFYANGGKDDDGNRTISLTADSAYEIVDKAPEFKKKGYSLSWSPSLETITKSCEVNAIWTINDYTLTFKNQNGEDFNNNSIKITYNQLLDYSKIEAPKVSGKKFACWVDAQGLPIDKGMIWDIDEGAVLSPVYVPQTDLVISYDLNGGNRQDTLGQRSFNSTTPIRITDPTRIGYSFDGWQINGEGEKYLSKELDLEKFMVNGELVDVALKATWNNVPYTASFDADGGEIIGQNQMEFFFGSVIEKLPTSQKENYEFVGWFYDGIQIKEGDLWEYAQDFTITAKYRAKYKVKFSLSSIVGVNNKLVVCKLVRWGDVQQATSLEVVEINLLEGQSLFTALGIGIMPVVDPIEEANINEYIFGNYWKYVDCNNESHKILPNTVFSAENLKDIKAGDTIILVPHIKLAWTPNY